VVDRDPFEEIDRMNAEDGGVDDPRPDPRHTEIVRLAKLSTTDYAGGRKDAAARLGLGLAALDKAVKAERAQIRAAVAEMLRCRPPPQPGEVRWPPGFTMKADGLHGPPGENTPPIWLARSFEVLGHSRDHAGECWGLWLRWHDIDGIAHTYALAADMIVAELGRLEAELANRGLRLAADPGARVLLRRALAEVQSGDRVRVAYATGWQGNDDTPCFLLPDGTVLGTPAEHVVLHAPAADAVQRCSTAGTLDGWKSEVAARAVGNPLAAFCIAGAFAGPLLLPAGETGGGFHFHGRSKVGKTLAEQMGLSAWGLPYKVGGALRDWRSTANALEAAGEECTDGLLTLDEIHQANPPDVAAAAYMLADGAGKRRLKRDASVARRRVWRTFILSTGEIDLATAVARAGQKLPAGAEVRLASVPVDDAATTWPALHGRADFPTLARDLLDAMRQYHGAAGRDFVARVAVLRANDADALSGFIDAMRDRFAKLLPSGADPQVREVARRCALVAAAGELAAKWGVLPWQPGEAEQAAATMLRAWIARRPGGSGSAEAAAHLEQVRTVLVQHGGARFVNLRATQSGWEEADPGRAVPNRIGWRRRTDDRDEFLIPPETWRTEMCAPAGLDATATARTLEKRGFLRRGEGKNLMPKERLPGFANPVRVYAVSAALMEAVDEDADAAEQ
jgi:putative DNA primase/helicase